jgi:hypothetical protein
MECFLSSAWWWSSLVGNARKSSDDVGKSPAVRLSFTQGIILFLPHTISWSRFALSSWILFSGIIRILGDSCTVLFSLYVSPHFFSCTVSPDNPLLTQKGLSFLPGLRPLVVLLISGSLTKTSESCSSRKAECTPCRACSSETRSRIRKPCSTARSLLTYAYLRAKF